MALPVSGANPNVRIRSDLYDKFQAGSALQQYVWNQIAPVIPADKLTGEMLLLDNAAFRTRQAVTTPGLRVTPSGVSSGQSVQAVPFLDTDLFSIDKIELDSPVTEATRINYGDRYSPDELAAMLVGANIDLESEAVTAALLTDEALTPPSGNTGVTLSAGQQWNLPTGEDPLIQINLGKERCRILYGSMPNTLVCNPQGFNNLWEHERTQFRLSASFGRDGIVAPRGSEQQLAFALGLDRVIVVKAVASATPGAAPADLWNRSYASLIYTDAGLSTAVSQQFNVPREVAGFMLPLTVRTMSLNRADIDAISGEVRMSEWFSPNGETKFIRGVAFRRPKLMKKAPRYLFKGVWQ